MEFDLNVRFLLCQPHSRCATPTPGLAQSAWGRPISLGFLHKCTDVLKLTHVAKRLASWLQQQSKCCQEVQSPDEVGC